MSQSDSAFHVSTDRLHVLVPCGCGDDGDRLRFEHTPDDKDPGQTMWLTASFAAQWSWRGRIKAAWRELRGHVHHDSAILSRKTVVELRDWLTERLGGANANYVRITCSSNHPSDWPCSICDLNKS